MNRAGFYRLFRGGLSELCKVAGIPVPQSRIDCVKEALQSRVLSKHKATQLPVQPPMVQPAYQQPQPIEPNLQTQPSDRRSIKIDPIVLLYYEYSRKQGYQNDLGTWLTEKVVDFFKSRGLQLGVFSVETTFD
jgi:hypothetical protein